MLKAHDHIYRIDKTNKIALWFYLLLSFLLVFVFVPWTQNIRAKGSITSLRQEQRPQQVNTIIGGRIEKWFVKEGDVVKKGDTLLQLSEIKEDYLDPDLLQRTAEQINAKVSTIKYYKGKIDASGGQMNALRNSLKAKQDQLKSKYSQAVMKLRSDSIDLVAITNDLNIASLQFKRQRAMFDSGLVSLTQLEQRNQYYQSTLAKKISSENKLKASEQELNIISIEFSAVQQDYREKILKAESDRFGSLSSVATGEGDIAKLKNLYASYTIRNGMYYILAPQDGQIIQAKKSGLGEVVKEGEMLVNIVPVNIDYAVELYVRPVDLPLLSTGQRVRFLFDGFPAIVFSGWPDASYGVFQGTIAAVENDVSENGKFKVLVKEDRSYRKWPETLRIGTGANGIALLKDVPIWYELWRNINSFPPDYYTSNKTEEKK
jgi:multidrug efflux pump subunit AcrA (membrane-fusion protein)